MIKTHVVNPNNADMDPAFAEIISALHRNIGGLKGI